MTYCNDTFILLASRDIYNVIRARIAAVTCLSARLVACNYTSYRWRGRTAQHHEYLYISVIGVRNIQFTVGRGATQSGANLLPPSQSPSPRLLYTSAGITPSFPNHCFPFVRIKQLIPSSFVSHRSISTGNGSIQILTTTQSVSWDFFLVCDSFKKY